MVLGVLHDIGLDSPRVDVCMYVCMYVGERVDRSRSVCVCLGLDIEVLRYGYGFENGGINK